MSEPNRYEKTGFCWTSAGPAIRGVHIPAPPKCRTGFEANHPKDFPARRSMPLVPDDDAVAPEHGGYTIMSGTGDGATSRIWRVVLPRTKQATCCPGRYTAGGRRRLSCLTFRIGASAITLAPKGSSRQICYIRLEDILPFRRHCQRSGPTF